MEQERGRGCTRERAAAKEALSSATAELAGLPVGGAGSSDPILLECGSPAACNPCDAFYDLCSFPV